MQKFISTKSLYSSIKKVGDEVQKGTTFVVLKYSQPAYKIVPLDAEDKNPKKYTLKDLPKFVFESKKKEKKIATDFKKYIYASG